MTFHYSHRNFFEGGFIRIGLKGPCSLFASGNGDVIANPFRIAMNTGSSTSSAPMYTCVCVEDVAECCSRSVGTELRGGAVDDQLLAIRRVRSI